jgi:DNA-binding MarR family transcriptional regulator
MTANLELAERLRVSIGHFVRTTRSHADTLSQPHAATLGLLDREGDLSIAALAERRGVRHQSMSRTVTELEQLGHLGRRRNPADGRGFLFALTPSGRLALEADRRARRDWLAQAIGEVLDGEERAVLGGVPELLDRLAAYRPVD